MSLVILHAGGDVFVEESKKPIAEPWAYILPPTLFLPNVAPSRCISCSKRPSYYITQRHTNVVVLVAGALPKNPRRYTAFSSTSPVRNKANVRIFRFA